jgi:hypothetical protein
MRHVTPTVQQDATQFVHLTGINPNLIGRLAAILAEYLRTNIILLVLAMLDGAFAEFVKNNSQWTNPDRR